MSESARKSSNLNELRHVKTSFTKHHIVSKFSIWRPIFPISCQLAPKRKSSFWALLLESYGQCSILYFLYILFCLPQFPVDIFFIVLMGGSLFLQNPCSNHCSWSVWQRGHTDWERATSAEKKNPANKAWLPWFCDVSIFMLILQYLLKQEIV